MKVLYCEQCDETITEDSCGLEFDGMYFCSDTCLYDYVNMWSDFIPKENFELYGEKPDDGTEGD